MTENTNPTRITRKKPTYDNPTNFLGKIPPQAVDLEEAVLGALMLEKDALTNVIDILKVESFYKEAHKVIFQAILDLFSESQPIDLLTVTTQLRKNGALEIAGGAFYVTELTSKVASAANIEYHARIITEQSIKRELIRISSEIQKDAFEDTTDVFELLDKMEQSMFEISEKNIRKNYSDMSSIMRDAIRELEERKNQKDGLTGVPSGFTALDRVTAGWQKSDLVIIAARPAMGKTAFVLSVLRNAAVDHSRPVAIFSLEMSAVQLVNRLISSEAELDSEKIKKGSLADHEWAQLVHKTAKLSKAPLFVDDTPALSILELRAKCRKLKAQHDIQMVVIDYLQLMSGDTKGGGGGGYSFGSYGTQQGNFQFNANFKKLDLAIGFENQNADGFSSAKDVTNKANFDKDGYQNNSFFVKAKYQIDTLWNIQLSSRKTAYTSAIDYGGFMDEKDNEFKNATTMSGLVLKYKKAKTDKINPQLFNSFFQSIFGFSFYPTPQK